MLSYLHCREAYHNPSLTKKLIQVKSLNPKQGVLYLTIFSTKPLFNLDIPKSNPNKFSDLVFILTLQPDIKSYGKDCLRYFRDMGGLQGLIIPVYFEKSGRPGCSEGYFTGSIIKKLPVLLKRQNRFIS